MSRLPEFEKVVILWTEDALEQVLGKSDTMLALKFFKEVTKRINRRSENLMLGSFYRDVVKPCIDFGAIFKLLM